MTAFELSSHELQRRDVIDAHEVSNKDERHKTSLSPIVRLAWQADVSTIREGAVEAGANIPLPLE